MDIFTSIEGQSGEVLGSTLLSYLIFNSHEVRESFISLLSDHSPIGPIDCVSHFSTRTEYPTKHDEFGDGRLDVLIQLDDVLIGIENKYFAEFQENQPKKYEKSLIDAAESLTKINHRKITPVIFVLCPESRSNHAQKAIEDIQNSAVVTWESILNSFKKVEIKTNPVAQVILNQFLQYLKRHFSFIPNFKRKLPHMKSQFPEYGNSIQQEMVSKLWSIFPYPGSRLSNGKRWQGYYFFTDPNIEEAGWYGFVPSNEIKGEPTGSAELVIATTYKPTFGSSFKQCEFCNDDFIGKRGQTNFFIIDFDESWNSLDKWRDNLAPLWEAVPNDIS